MRIHAVFATTGRPDIVRKVVARLAQQSRAPDGIIVVGAAPADVDGVADVHPDCEVLIAERGLCKQRNAALNHLEGKSDVIAFFDDDFVAADDFLENLERLFAERDDVVGATGILIADGAHTAPIDFETATQLNEDTSQRPQFEQEKCLSLYGCNMAFKMDAADGLRFDEKLPLYGWQEDVDFTHQLSWRGTLLRTSEITGVHMGARSGKTSGKRLGYSQVANIVYLRRKGTMVPGQGERLMARNVVSNVVRSFWSESDIDRRGRLIGNLMAARDLIKGTIDPRKIEAL